ncbi:conserved hypothetical protein [Candidatus Glomeribacter gigasporarum BEG34]|uniref:HTH cro/C1-type domain-containing protein n=1 Tax=Candidatus Glomeribacter gigasporarum BEG34 TaxID=1070319 RepID=G2JB18_9BURK|nr:helix-turn-helix transcriptional regulator [Candidatus Glomeribacter gigasporarum]CCD29970.1 conserved hypothetical protein [Candidatus Glomeribacter gigasporarum BEG34]
MHSIQQKNEFAARLHNSLNKNSTSAKGAVALARLFNAQQPDVAGISVQTAHKWLTGRAIPAYEKMRALAECLDIDFQWLRDGVYPVRL